MYTADVHSHSHC